MWSRHLLLFGLGCATGASAQSISYLGETIAGYRTRVVAADASGVYAVGDRLGLELVESDKIIVGKYDHEGNELWVRRFGAYWDTANGVALHNAGVYVVGLLGGAPFVRKYDADGNEQWARTFGAGVSYSNNLGVAADAGGVYVLVNLYRPFLPPIALLRKYHAEGAEAWSREINAYTGGVTTDGTGVYVAGYTTQNGVQQGLVRKYDFNGTEIWTGSTPGATSHPAADATGIYVVGGGYATDGPYGYHRFVHKYDANGAELWSARVFPQNIKNLAVDATGLYVIGSTGSTAPGQCAAGLEDAVVTRFDLDGRELWIRQFGRAGYDFPAGIGLTSTGIYMAVHPFLVRLEKMPDVIPESVPQISWECVLNAASLEGGGVAPGEIVTILGSTIGPPDLTSLRVNTDGRLATMLADTRILFDGTPAPLLYVSAKQSSAIVPYAVAEKSSVDVQVEFKGVRSSKVTVPVLASRPGIFTLDGSGSGPGAVLNEDGSINSPSNPAQLGTIVTIYATGEGLTEPAGVDGLVLRDVLPKPKLPVHVLLTDAFWDSFASPDIIYAGGVSGAVGGLLQVNLRLPQWWTGSLVAHLLIGKPWEWNDPLPRGVTISVR